MTDPVDDKEYQKLLDRLDRIEEHSVRLEHKLQKTEFELDVLQKAFAAELESAVKHHKVMCQRIADIHEYLWPLVYKVFPEYLGDETKIAALIKRQVPKLGDKEQH